MKSITRNLLESLNESTSGNTIKDYAMNYLDGYIDNDVTDTEIDMMVAFSFDFNEEPDVDFKAYSDFMNLIAERTKVVKVNDSEYGATLVCDFSSVFKPYNEQLKEFFNMENSEFDEDEAWAEAVVNLEALISGNAGDSSYNELISILNSKQMNESVDEDSGPYTVTGIAHVIDWYDSEGTIEMEPYDILEITPENICQGANDNGFGVKEITGVDAYVSGEEYSYSGDEFKKYSQGKEQRGIQIPKTDLGKIDNIEYYVLYSLDETYPVIKVNDKFLITRQGTNDFSGQWRLEGFIEANRYNYKWMISPTEALNISDWKYKNGNPKYTVIDYDHGSSRRWGGGGTSHCPYGFSSIDVDGFKRVIGNEDSIKIEDKTYSLKSSVNESDAMLEAQHKTQKAEYTLIPVNEPKIKELEGGSAFTWEGLDTSSKSLNSIVEFFKENTPNIKLPIEFFTWKGSEMNRIYGLTGDNAYPDDLNFVSIALDNWDGMGALPMIKFQVGARWLDDIVDNNARRQGNLDESADLTAEVTYHDEDGTRDYVAGKLSDGRYFLIGQQEQILVSDKDLPNLAKKDMDDFRYDEDGDKDFIETLENGTTLDKNSDLAKIIINACRDYLDDGCYLLSESANIDVNNLTKEQLWKLRQEIVLGSLYTHDYDNSFGIDPSAVCNFFDSFIEDAQVDDYGKPNNRKTEEYDNAEDLYNYYCSCENPFGEVEEINESFDGKNIKTDLHNDRTNPVWVIGNVSIDNDTYRVNAKVYSEPSNLGIDKGPVSKLYIAKENKYEEDTCIVNYDRGWSVKPTDETEEIYNIILRAVVTYRKDRPYETSSTIEDDTNINESEDVKRDLAIEPGSDEEATLDSLYDRKIKNYICSYCHKSIKNINDFDKKFYKDYGTEYVCPYCGEPYSFEDLKNIARYEEV